MGKTFEDINRVFEEAMSRDKTLDVLVNGKIANYDAAFPDRGNKK